MLRSSLIFVRRELATAAIHPPCGVEPREINSTVRTRCHRDLTGRRRVGGQVLQLDAGEEITDPPLEEFAIERTERITRRVNRHRRRIEFA